MSGFSPGSLSSSQRKLALTLIRRGRKNNATYKQVIAALETGIVESGLANLSGGDGSSVGWRQETASSYPGVDRRNVRGGADRFYNETSPLRKQYGEPGSLAAAVQRPRAEYRGRYSEHKSEAEAIYHALAGKASGGGGSGGGTKTIPGVDRSGQRRALIASYLVNEPNDVAPQVNSKSPMTIANSGDQTGSNLIDLVSQVGAIKDTPSRTVATGGAPSSGGHSGNSKVDAMLNMARAFDKHHTTYLWGGGHGGIAGPADRVDCSGYVSAILHAGGLLGSPTTSGGLMSWGHSGKGKYVTVYANSGHVLINIGSRWFATSHSNPGGGPGEIPRPDSGYLSSFSARHPGLA